jgi:hypothetical protein
MTQQRMSKPVAGAIAERGVSSAVQRLRGPRAGPVADVIAERGVSSAAQRLRGPRAGPAPALCGAARATRSRGHNGSVRC